MSTARRVWRFTVPVDGEVHRLELPLGNPLHIACRKADMVDVWFETVVDDRLDVQAGMTQARNLTVVGTGFRVPPNAKHVGSCIDPSGQMVWHLYEQLLPSRLPREALKEGRLGR